MTRLISVSVLCMSFCAAGWAAEPAGQKSTNDRQAAAKKLADAQAALRAAIVALAEAEKAAEAAEDETTRAAATKRVAEARAKLDAARNELARQNTEALNAAARTALVRRVSPRGRPPERETVDPQDSIERFALLTPGGPVVVEASLTIDGRPFRMAREKLIDEMLAAADKDKDGKFTWDEALGTAKFTLGRVRFADARQRRAYTQSLDRNVNGVADRNEVRQFLAQFFQGPTFTLGGPAGYSSFSGGFVLVNGRVVPAGGSQADVRALLDADNDGVLSESEIAGAPERLKSRDADDNDLLDPAELSATIPAAQSRQGEVAPGAQTPSFAVLLGPTATAEMLWLGFGQYKDSHGQIANVFNALPGLFETLDKNQDGRLDEYELHGLNDVPPHVELVVDLNTAGSAKGITLKSLAAEVAKTKETAELVSLAVPGAQLSLTANLAALPAARYQPIVSSLVKRYDKDGNGYLEKEELPPQVAQQFALWDADENGKVFADEIAASYERMQAPQATQVVASIASQESSLFGALDTSGDLRLSLREMRVAAERMQALDKDGDHRLTAHEIPATIAVSFGLGGATFGPYSSAESRASNPARGGNSPEWFQRMDRNGDGDVTLKEFLGTPSQFGRLDANGDGFLEPTEAQAAAR